MRIRVHLNDERVKRAIRRATAAGVDMTPATLGIGEFLLRTTRRRFDTQESPEGVPWAPLSEDYRRRKRRNADKILTLDGYLRGGLNFRAGRDYVDIGSDRIYAGPHQYGAEKGEFGTTGSGKPIPFGDIPARPFLGVSDEDSDEINVRIADYISGAWRGSRL